MMRLLTGALVEIWDRLELELAEWLDQFGFETTETYAITTT